MVRPTKTGVRKVKPRPQSLAERLRKYRTDLKLTQEQLAEKAEVSAGTVSSAELGRGHPREETARKLARALGLRGLAHTQFMDAARRAARPTPAANKLTPRNIRPTRNRRSLQVFLCHASEDRAVVRALYDKLKRKPGIRPWLDKIDLIGGQDWDSEIHKSVRASGVVVVCLSRISVKKEGYVQKELRVALDVAREKPEGTIFIIPLKLEQCDIPASLEPKHCVDYYESGGYNKLLKALRTRIRLRDQNSSLYGVTPKKRAKPKRRATGR